MDGLQNHREHILIIPNPLFRADLESDEEWVTEDEDEGEGEGKGEMGATNEGRNGTQKASER